MSARYTELWNTPGGGSSRTSSKGCRGLERAVQGEGEEGGVPGPVEPLAFEAEHSSDGSGNESKAAGTPPSARCPRSLDSSPLKTFLLNLQ